MYVSNYGGRPYIILFALLCLPMEKKDSTDSSYLVPPPLLKRSAYLAAALHALHEKEEKAVPRPWFFVRFRDIHLQDDDRRDFHHAMAMHFRQLNGYLSTCSNRKPPGNKSQTWSEFPCGMAAIRQVDLAMECALRESTTGNLNAASCINGTTTNINIVM